MKQSQVIANKLIRSALAVLLMGTLAACGSGPTISPNGPEKSSGPFVGEPGANSRSPVQRTVTAAPSATATIAPVTPDVGPAGQSGSDAQPSGAIAGATAAPEAPAITEMAAAPSGNKSAPALDLSNRNEVRVDLSQFRQLLPRDAINPIYEPRFVSPEYAGLEPGELVIGVELNGESKAYPIGPLVRREMVNDTVGGVPILVTW